MRYIIGCMIGKDWIESQKKEFLTGVRDGYVLSKSDSRKVRIVVFLIALFIIGLVYTIGYIIFNVLLLLTG